MIDPNLPATIDGYRVIRRIAKTGLSEVFEVSDEAGRRLCLKRMLPPPDERASELTQKFQSEAKLLAQVSHPGIVRIEKVGLFEGSHYLCMELVEGGSLHSLIQSGTPLPIEDFFDVALQITGALIHVHQKGVVHQDLKPDNVLVRREGKRLSAKIADFGLADAGVAQQDAFVGTLAYVSPEQARLVDWPVDARSDLYSLGVLLYQLLTGALPFGKREGAQLLAAHLSEPPQPMTELRNDLPPLLQRIVCKLLAKRPEDRYQSAAGLQADLAVAHERFQRQEADASLELDSRRFQEQRLQESFVGRARELAQLEGALQNARSGHLSLLFVGGVAGVGKSSLLREFANRARVSGARFAYGKNYEFSRALPYFCLGEALEDFRAKLRSAPERTRREIEDRIQTGVGPASADLIQVAPGYRELFPVKTEIQYQGEQKDRQRFFQMLHAYLGAVSMPMAPLVLLLDDLQWADSGMLTLLSQLVDQPQTQSVLILCTYRSEEVSGNRELETLLKAAGGAEFASVVELQPFDRDETSLQISQSLSNREQNSLPSGLVDELFQRTQGNAFFVSELLKILLASGALKREKEFWSYDGALAQSLQIPSDVVSLVLRRLESLDPSSRRLLGVAAWIGTGFSFDEAVGVSAFDPSAVFEMLKAAVGQRILRDESNGTYQFSHDRIHEACKNLVAETERPDIHGRIVAYLERSSTSLSVFRLAEHSIEAQDPARIGKYGFEAGVAARARHSNSQALRYFELALRHAGDAVAVDEDRIRREVAEILALLGRYEEAISHYQLLLGRTADRIQSSRYISLIAECLQRRGEYGPARLKLLESLGVLGVRIWQRAYWLPTLVDQARFRLARLAPRLFRSNEKTVARRKAVSDALRKLWFVHIIQDIRPLAHISSRLLAVTSRLGPSEELAVALQLHAMSLANQRRPDWEDAMSFALRSVEVGRAAQANQVIAGSMVRLAAFSTWRGDHAAGLEYSNRAREMLTAIGNLWDLANAHIFGFLCRKARGELDEAMSHANTMVELAKKTGSKGTLCSGQIKIGELLSLKGRSEEGLELVASAVALAIEGKLDFDAFQGLKTWGGCLLRMGRFREAREKFDQAIAILEKNGGGFFRAYHSEAFLGWAEAALKGRDPRDQAGATRAMIARADRLERDFKDRGHVLRLEAMLDAVEGRIDSAARKFDQAIALFGGQGRPLDEAICRLEAGRALSAAKSAAAVSHLKFAWVLFKQTGAVQLIPDCQELLKGLGETITQDEKNEKDAKLLLDSLLEIGLASVQSLDPLTQARAILDKVNQLMNSDRAMLFLWDETALIPRFQIGRGRDRQDIQVAEGYSTTIIKRAMTSRQPVVVAGTEQGALLGSESAVVHNLLSMVATPICLQQRLIGALYLDHQLIKGVFTDKDTQILQAIAQHIGVAIQSTQLARLEVDHKELEKNLEVTRAVQSLLLPKHDTYRSEQLEMAAFYCSASQSGGDWWSYEKLSDERFLLMMGDVTGHGPGPAMITAAVAGCINTFKQTRPRAEGAFVEDLLRTIDAVLRQLCQDAYWMTFTVVDIDLGKSTFTLWSSGAPPVFKVAPDSEVSVLAAGGAPLGGEEFSLGKEEGTFEPGTKILLFSDGVHEMKTAGGMSFGIRRTRKLFQELSAASVEQLRGQLWEKLESWKGKDAQLDDDVTFMVIERLKTARKAA